MFTCVYFNPQQCYTINEKRVHCGCIGPWCTPYITYFTSLPQATWYWRNLNYWILFNSIGNFVPILIQVESNHDTSIRNKCLQVTQLFNCVYQFYIAENWMFNSNFWFHLEFSLTGDIPRSFWRPVMLLSTRLPIRKVNSGIACIKVMS